MVLLLIHLQLQVLLQNSFTLLQEDNNVTYIGYDGGEVVDGFGRLVMFVTTHYCNVRPPA